MTHCSDQEPGLDSQLVSSTPRTAVAQASQAFGAAVIWSPGSPCPPRNSLVLVTVHSASTGWATVGARPPCEPLPTAAQGSARQGIAGATA